MNLSCNVVMDLTSLYKDGLASAETVKAVREHLKECPSCRRYYRNYDHMEEPIGLDVGTVAVAPVEDGYMKLHKRIRRRRIAETAAVVVSLCAAAAVLAVSLYQLNQPASGAGKAKKEPFWKKLLSEEKGGSLFDSLKGVNRKDR